jgi:hypothetical protein
VRFPYLCLAAGHLFDEMSSDSVSLVTASGSMVAPPTNSPLSWVTPARPPHACKVEQSLHALVSSPMEELPPEPPPPAANPVSSHTTPLFILLKILLTSRHISSLHHPIISSRVVALPLPIILLEAQRWHQATTLQAP